MRILIATDGSEYSNAAIDRCAQLIADPVDTRVKVVSAFEEAYVLAAEPFALSADFYQQVADTARQQAGLFAEDGAKRFRAKFAAHTEMPVTTEVMRGDPAQQIVALAKEWKADLIVVGSHGRGFWGRLIGSVSDAVVHHAPCSVIVVRMPA